MRKIICTFLVAAAFAATINTTEGMKRPNECQLTGEELEIVSRLTGKGNMSEDQLIDIVHSNFDRVKSWIATLPSATQKAEEEDACFLIAHGVPFGDEFMQATEAFRLKMRYALCGFSICEFSRNGEYLDVSLRSMQENYLSIIMPRHDDPCNLPLACKALESNVPFHKVVFRGIRDEEAEQISKSLMCNSTLMSLAISFNCIENEGARAISESLVRNSTLTSLDIGGNRIEREGAGAISASLNSNTTLTELDLSGNPGTDINGEPLSGWGCPIQ